MGKIGRGFINVSQEHNDKRKATMVEDFFAINERTPEKEAILRGEKWEPEPEPQPAPEKPASKPKTQKRRNSKKTK